MRGPRFCRTVRPGGYGLAKGDCGGLSGAAPVQIAGGTGAGILERPSSNDRPSESTSAVVGGTVFASAVLLVSGNRQYLLTTESFGAASSEPLVCAPLA